MKCLSTATMILIIIIFAIGDANNSPPWVSNEKRIRPSPATPWLLLLTLLISFDLSLNTHLDLFSLGIQKQCWRVSVEAREWKSREDTLHVANLAWSGREAGSQNTLLTFHLLSFLFFLIRMAPLILLWAVTGIGSVIGWQTGFALNPGESRPRLVASRPLSFPSPRRIPEMRLSQQSWLCSSSLPLLSAPQSTPSQLSTQLVIGVQESCWPWSDTKDFGLLTLITHFGRHA